MAKQNLNDWVKLNRSEFDDKELPVDHRSVFENKLDNFLKEEKKPQKTKRLWFSYAAAAAIVIALTTSVLFINNNNRNNVTTEQNLVAANFEEIEDEYSIKIKEALIPVRSSRKYLSREYRSFFKEMENLDRQNEALKELLLEYPDDERILNSIIENYKSRLKLLEDLKVLISNKNLNNVTNENISQ